MRPRRSLFFVAPAIPAGSTSCKPPAPTTRPFRFFTSHATWFFPVPTATPRRATTSPTNEFFMNHESRDTNHGLYAFLAAFLRVVTRLGAAMARHGRPPSPAPAKRPVGFHESRITAFIAVRFALGAKGSHNRKPPSGQPCPPPGHGFPVHDCSPLFAIVHYFFYGGGPEQVSAHRPPFSVGLAASAVLRSSRRSPSIAQTGERFLLR